MLHTWQKNRAIRGADFIICISENTKNDLLKFLPDVDERKIRVIYNGVSEEYMPIIGNVLDKNLPFSVNSYVLFVGSRASYKNFYIAVEAIADSDYNFVIVGDPLTERESSILSSLFKGRNRYKCVGRVSNCFLNVLYNYAFALLYPSSYEGFGIPIIEAQKAGCPAIAYNASSIPEIIGNPRLLINTLSVNEIHNCLMILTNKEERQHIILEGIKNARRFSWDEMYKNIIDLYKEAWNMR